MKSGRYTVHNFTSVDLVSKSLPCFIQGAVLPKPGIDKVAIEGGLRKRLYHKTIGYSHSTLARLRKFVFRWCHQHLTPLKELHSFDEWLAASNYSLKRKEQLIEAHAKADINLLHKYPVKCHVKDEFYETWKYLRMISSRTDEAKTIFGPIFHSIETEVYKLPYFVKGLTEQERIEKIVETFGKRAVYVTDYSAFETHFTPDLLAHCEFVMYKYMLQGIPGAIDKLKVLLGSNRLVSRYFHGLLEGVRMSGEMNTSLGNGFSNLMLMLFIAEEQGFKVLNCLVEGDDGLFEISGKPPTAALFKSYGLELKIAPALPHTASFCGCVFNPDNHRNFGHPLKHLIAFGWTGRRHLSLRTKKATELLMSRIYSFCALYPGVPLIWKLCELCLRKYQRVKFCRAKKYLDRYKQGNITFTERVVSPDLSDRLFFEEITGITPCEQLCIETEMETTFPAIHSDVLLSHLPQEWKNNWDVNVEPFEEAKR